jgi:hypothetical protein
MARRFERFLAVAVAMAACSNTPRSSVLPDASEDNVTVDVTPDQQTTQDSGPETTVDIAVDAQPDVAPEASADVPADAVTDAMRDAATDAMRDATTDLPVDATMDAATDASMDARADVGTDSVSADVPVIPARELWLLRVGDGMTALSNASTPVFIERRSSSDGSMRAATIALPTAMVATNHPVSLSGTATSEGALNRSVDGRFVTLAGYAAAPGMPSIAGTAASAVPRVVARVSAAGAVDSTTTLGMAFSANNVRSAVTTDGSAFWVSGTAASMGGIQYKTLGSAGEPVGVVTTPSNVRVANIFGGQLYGSTSTSTPAPGYYGVFSAGTGTATTAGQTATMLPGFPAMAGVSVYGFALIDRDMSVAGLDTLYLADDRLPASGGGVLRWRLSAAGTWSQDVVINVGITAGVRGLTVWIEGSTAYLAAVTGENPSRVVVYADVAGMPVGAPAVVATAPMNTQFRGIALAPAP